MTSMAAASGSSNQADTKGLVAESEPGEIVNGAEAGRLQSWKEGRDREDERNDLADDREHAASGFDCDSQDSESTSDTASGTAGINQRLAGDPVRHPLS